MAVPDPPSPPPALDVAIVSFRCQALLHDCLASLRDNPPAGSMRIHVVDNGSDDGTVAMVRREFPDVVVAESEDNLGFSKANNIGFAGGVAPYLLALNPDTRILPGALDSLLALMEQHPEVGISGPRLELDDGSFDHASARSFPTPLGALGHFTGLGRRQTAGGALSQYRAAEFEPGPVDAVNGAFMLMRREIYDALGGFDEGYWMYMEDLDLCYRFARAGWTTWFEPSVTVIHVKAGSSGSNRTWKLNRAFHYGMFRFYRDHYASDRNPLVNAAVYCGIAVKLALALVRSAAGRVIAGVRAPRGRT